MRQENDYWYDAFISYCDDNFHLKFVSRLFIERFRFHLANSVGRPVKVYFDKEVNQPGDKWEVVIKNALARSRVLVPIWSIQYFHSKWCRTECAIMLHREEQLGYLRQERPGSLIVPIKLADGKYYPEVARRFHQFNCYDYNDIRASSSMAEKLGRQIKTWVDDVAERIKNAPRWDRAWLGPEWLEEPVRECEATKRLWLPEMAPEQIESIGDEDG